MKVHKSRANVNGKKLMFLKHWDIYIYIGVTNRGGSNLAM